MTTEQKTTLYFGSDIKLSNTEVLQPLQLEQVWERITDKQSPLVKSTQLLRRVARLDKAASQALKIRLPFICCGQFANGIRNQENFCSAAGFVLDVDRLNGDPDFRRELLNRFRQDEQIALFYISPSGQGIKLVFLLEQPLTDAAVYRTFYKNFAIKFGLRYQLENELDSSTCDVSRVSFICHDESAWFNPVPIPVRYQEYLPPPFMPSVELTFSTTEATAEVQPPSSNGMNAAQYREILDSLHPERPPRAPKQIFVPQLLSELMVQVQVQAAAAGIGISAVMDIHYGKKIRFVHGAHEADINLFYGKKGFTIVKVPRRGTHEMLADIGERLTRLAISFPIPVKKEEPNGKE